MSASSTVVSHKYALPFCNLSLSTKRRGAYMRDAPFSLAIMPSLLVPHNNTAKHDLIVGGGWGPNAKREAERCSRC